jgi:hypothetical protein
MLMSAHRIGYCILLAGVTAWSGCTDGARRRGVVDYDDHVPPAEPRDVYTITGDGAVTLYWSPPGDADLAGYRVYISQDDQDYWLVADLPTSQRHLVVHGGLLPANVPFTFVNGNTYWFGVEARDDAGNTSELTDAAVGFDTPRPAGRDLRLWDVGGIHAAESGYDFSRSPYGYALDGSSLFADVYFSIEAGVPYLRTAHPEVVEMQDKGFVDFDDDRVGWLFEDEWLPGSQVVARPGHVILFKLWEETRPGNAAEPFHVAKVQVVAVEPGAVVLDWAYQIAPNNRELKPVVPPAAPVRTASNAEVQP